jgi:DNA-binding MarR family transcriptional regulator
MVTRKQAPKLADKSADEPADKTAGKIAGELVGKLVGELADTATDKSALKPATRAADKAASKPPRKLSKSVDDNPPDTRYLETLLGYNARRAALVIIEVFLKRMAVYQLRPVEFSVLSLIGANPGIVARQISNTLGILPPNLVVLIRALQTRDLIGRKPHPSDGRALGLHLTETGKALLHRAQDTASALEVQASQRLSVVERKTLIELLQKVYL